MKRRTPGPRLAAFTASATAALFLASGVAPAYAGGCVAIMSQRYVNTLNQASRSNMYKTHNPLPAHITTEAQCQQYLRSFWNYAGDSGYRETRCECSGSSGGGGGGGGFSMPTAPYGSRQFGQQLALGIVQQGLESLLAGPKGPSPEEIARQQAEEAERRRIAEEAARRAAEEAARLAAIEKARRLGIAAGMKTPDGESAPAVGGGGAVGLLAWKGFDDAPAAPPSGVQGGSSGTGTKSALDRLRCAQAFSEAAKQYASMTGGGSAENARFYSLQSQKALSGEPLDAECPASSGLPDVPMPTGIEIVYPGEGTIPELIGKARADMAALDNVHIRRRELTERKAAVEAKRKEAEEKVAKPPAPPAEGAPAPAPDADTDAMKAEAEALLRESEAELAEIGKSEESLAAEETRLTGNLKRYEAKAASLEAAQAAKAGK